MEVLGSIRARLAEHAPVICVSTQLIEAGVDIDFGSVIRYMAGLDSIAQAAGRCNRHGLRETGRVLIVNLANENLGRLPDIRIAQEKTAQFLDDFHRDPASFDYDPVGPASMERFYRYYFHERAHEMNYPVAPPRARRHDTLLSLLSTNDLSVAAYIQGTGTAPQFSLRQSFATAAGAFEVLDAPTRGIIVPYAEEGRRIIADLCSGGGFDEKRAALKAAQRFSVNIFPYEMEQLVNAKGVYEAWEESGVYCLDNQHYSSEFGLGIGQGGQMPHLIG
jgi:CRISPR-associated endonuclease/helicase Cas3